VTQAQQHMLTYAEAAQMLGVRIRYVRRMVQEGRLPAIRLGHRTVRIPEAAIKLFIANHKEG
jgi:excisionase family DNA binding protein